jgi:hypothetical protein
MLKQAKFTPGSIIRDITTGHPYLVIQRMTNTILVVDAHSHDHSHDRLNNIKAILARDFEFYCDDIDMKCRVRKDEDRNSLEWEQNLVTI